MKEAEEGLAEIRRERERAYRPPKKKVRRYTKVVARPTTKVNMGVGRLGGTAARGCRGDASARRQGPGTTCGRTIPRDRRPASPRHRSSEKGPCGRFKQFVRVCQVR